jgi:hypothetical protein
VFNTNAHQSRTASAFIRQNIGLFHSIFEEIAGYWKTLIRANQRTMERFLLVCINTKNIAFSSLHFSRNCSVLRILITGNQRTMEQFLLLCIHTTKYSLFHCIFLEIAVYWKILIRANQRTMEGFLLLESKVPELYANSFLLSVERSFELRSLLRK